MAKKKCPQQGALKASRTGWLHTPGGIAHVDLLQCKVHMLGKEERRMPEERND